LVERYATFIYASAHRRTGSAELAQELTRAVFLVLARRACRLRVKTVLAGWLFQVTAIAARKLPGKPRATTWWRWFRRKPKHPSVADAPLWMRVVPGLDAAIDRLSSARRDALLLRVFLQWDLSFTACILRTSERGTRRRAERGLKEITRRFRRQDVLTDPEALAQACAAEGCATCLPENLVPGILASIDENLGRRPAFPLARRTLRSLAWRRWRRRVGVGVPTVVLMLLTAVAITWYVESRTGFSRLISMFFVWSVKHEGKTVPGLAQPARPWPEQATGRGVDAAGVNHARDLYQTTNLWPAHLTFTRAEWSAVQPKRIEPLPHFFQPDGTVLLRHPEAQRSGLAGVLGFDFHWSSANLEFGGLPFTNTAVRIKGNGTYLGSLYGDKCSFKVDLNKLVKGRKLGEVDELTFNNLVNDHSCLSDALAYEFFRDAGVPAARTAYAYLEITVEGKWRRKPLGLYVMVEAVDEGFTLERFGSKRTPIFKPVTYDLFQHLGDDWAAYAAIYDLKTRATPAQQERVIEFARLLTLAEDATFAGRVGEFLDLEKFARYLACEVLLANYDSFLSNGQNYYLYLDPGSNKFGFIPWDLDLSWGGFFLLGTAPQRARASIWHPWVGRHRFLERVMAVESFRELYRAQLEELLARLFVPSRLYQRIDDVANVIRSPIVAESDFRLGKFEEAISTQRPKRPADQKAQGADRPAHPIKWFIEARIKSVRQQLDGKTKGVILERAPGQ